MHRLLELEFMLVRRVLARLLATMMAVTAISCSTAASSASLHTGMTSDQAIQAMGPPDLTDSVADPSRAGSTAMRYVWLEEGKVALFGANNRLETLQNIEPAAKTQAEAQAMNQPPTEFDPIGTPLNYTFFPLKAALIYLGAGLNCVAGGGCRKPQLPSPSSS
jgi:hypothetical protein